MIQFYNYKLFKFRAKQGIYYGQIVKHTTSIGYLDRLESEFNPYK